MALQYPLLFPWGDFDWSPDLTSMRPGSRRGAAGNGEEHFDDSDDPGADKDNMTFREWAAYRLMARNDDGVSLLLGRRLTQQAMVDMWASIEMCRLR